MDERVRSTPPIATTAARAARTAMQQIARRAVPAIADFAVVFVVAGRSIIGIASAHSSPSGARMLRTLLRIYRVRLDDLHSTVAHVVRTGRPYLRREIVHDHHARVTRGSVEDLHRRLACKSALVLPIRVGDMVTGAVSLCYAESGRSYRASDLANARRVMREVASGVSSPLPHAAPRLRAATGDTRRHAAIRR